MLKKIFSEWNNASFWKNNVPSYLMQELNPLRPVAWKYWDVSESTISFPDEDWDNLIILDACRYDHLSDLVPEENVGYKISPGTDTGQSLRSHFPPGTEYNDIVYINGNPRVANISIGRFHHMEHVWKSSWNEAKGTVMPSSIYDEVARAQKRFPNKRIIAHFIQPHIPFIGETAKKLPNGATIQKDREYAHSSLSQTKENGNKPYEALENGNATSATIQTAYHESLKIAFDYVEKAVKELHGKTVVTADHGELLGNRLSLLFNPFRPHAKWGHPADTPISSLVKVPWWTPPFSDRKKIIPGETTVEANASVSKEQLESLGYLSSVLV